jgi:ADP-heptose:LPS heptosyltransferase
MLIIRPGGIGDAALLAPAIYALRQRFPQATIDILAEKRNGGTFALIPGISKVHLYDSLTGVRNVLTNRYDLVIDTEQWHRLSALLARATRAPFLVGFDSNERSRMFTHPVNYSHEEYEADSFIHLLAPLGIECRREPTAHFLFPTGAAVRSASELLAPLENAPFITVFPGASTKVRLWGSDRFKQVVQFLDAKGLRAVIIGGREDIVQGEEIVSGNNAINLAGKTNLSVTAAIIATSGVLLSGDSGVLHLGVGVGAATVSLFGPGISAKWAPQGSRHIVLSTGLPCSPCTRFGTTPPCPNGVRCLTEISVEDVCSALMRITVHKR